MSSMDKEKVDQCKIAATQHQIKVSVCTNNRKITCEENNFIPPLSSILWCKNSSLEGKCPMDTFN